MADDPTAAPWFVQGDVRIKQFCASPAPLVANGHLFVGCQLDKDHDGPHKVEITWGTSV